MRSVVRLRPTAPLLGLVLLSVLVLVPAAAAAPGSHRVDGLLSVATVAFGERSLTSIDLASTDAVARIEVFSPTGYAVDLAAPPGTELGFASGRLSDVPGTSSSFVDSGIVVEDPARHVGTAESEACAPGRHEAVWKATFSVLGQAYPLPIYVDRQGPGPLSGLVLRFCPVWRTPALPAGVTADRLGIFVANVVRQSEETGRYTWSAFVSPPLPSLAPDPSHTFEVRSTDLIPHTLTLRSSYDAKRKVAVVSGALTGAGVPEPGVEVGLTANTASGSIGVSLPPATTNASGEFSITRRVDETTAFSASASIPDGPCSSSSTAPAGCLRETFSSPASGLTLVRVRLATDPKLVPRARDQAAARRSTLTLADLPPGWEAFESFPAFECGGFRPRLSSLTATGDFESKIFATEAGAAASRALVLVSEAQARTAFARIATSGLVRCFAEEYRRDDEVRILQLGPTSFPRLGNETRAFRIVWSLGEDVVSEDFVYFRKGRTVVQLRFAALSQPLVDAEQFARKVAARTRA